MSSLVWAQPEWLHGLWVLALVALAFHARHRRRIRRLRQLVPGELAEELTPRLRAGNEGRRTALRLLAAAGVVVSLARPQVGFTWEEVQRRGLDLMVVFDTSNSMLATDFKPNRMEAARLAVLDLVEEMRGDRIGLVAFAGSSFLQCPLTVDYSAFRLTLADMYPGIIPTGGTAIGQALDKALESFDDTSRGDKVILLITDGEAHKDDVEGVLARLKEQEVRVMVAGAGTLEGELIPVPSRDNDGNARTEFLKDAEGRVVKTALKEGLLENIALETGGMYVRALQRDFGLTRIYREGIAPLQREDQESKRIKRHHDRFQWPLAAAWLVLLIEAAIHRPRRAKEASR